MFECIFCILSYKNYKYSLFCVFVPEASNKIDYHFRLIYNWQVHKFLLSFPHTVLEMKISIYMVTNINIY